ncbi:MAG: MFS transporter [Melioribacteraceae bacterium]|jgi:dipeptide/tripeptide permease|nr:MFS transporter [Melioribacteraceae bacterium]
MNISDSLKKLKTGFTNTFWVANGMELFERLAYYGQATILSVFLRDHLKFDEVEAGQLSSIFGGLIYFLPIFAGALADKFGFKKAFSFAFFVLAIGYFLIGSTGMAMFSGWYSESNLFLLLSIILIFTAIGGSFIKPSVLGTVALTTTSETKSLGYAIYYWLVNIGAAIGPLLAYFVRDSFGIEFVYMVSAISCALMFLTTLVFFKEPEAKLNEKRDDIITVAKNLITVVKNVKFMFFLMLFALYWIVFWEFFIVIPFYVSDYISPEAPIELILSVGAWTIILFQIPINRFTKDIPTPKAIMIGFVFAALSWFLLYFAAILGFTVGIGLIIATIFVFSVGEQTQAPRFYEYLADLAPKGQAALFQGFAFLPIAIAWLVGGTFGGWIYKTFATEAKQPEMVFLIIGLIGVVAAILMWVYNKFAPVKK